MPSEGEHGDLLATVNIVLPDSADEDLKALMQRWREQQTAADPRKDFV